MKRYYILGGILILLVVLGCGIGYGVLQGEEIPSTTESHETIFKDRVLIPVATSTPPIPETSKVTYKSTPFPIEVTKTPRVTFDSIHAILAKIARCESGNDPLAKNKKSSAKGLLQIIDGTWESFKCEGSVLNPDDNMRCGVKIATQSGLHHWNESRSCWIKAV